MPYDSVRAFLTRLEAEGQLVRIREKVKPEPDIRAAACAAARMPGGPALLFENVEGYANKQVAMNVHGSFQNHALMLDLPKETGPKAQFQELVRRWDRYPIPPRHVSDAPLKEVIIDRNPSLYKEDSPSSGSIPTTAGFTFQRHAWSLATRKRVRIRTWACTGCR